MPLTLSASIFDIVYTCLNFVNRTHHNQLCIDRSPGSKFFQGHDQYYRRNRSRKINLVGRTSIGAGKRADLSTLKDKSKKCFVEATFSISAYQLQAFFDTVDLDYEPITTIRREIVPSGKSRAFINDTPVTLDVLSQLGEKLIDIHSQHQTLSLTQEDYQLEVLDALAGNKDNLIAYQEYRQQFFRIKMRSIN